MINSLPLQTRQTLKALGFNENECLVLLPLLAQRKLKTRDISQQTALSFETTHYTLHLLQKKGLVKISAKDKEDVVEICTNEEFLQWIEKQKRMNSEVYDDAKSVIFTFLTKLTESNWKPDVMYFEGKQGVIDIYRDMLATNKDIYGWTDIEKIRKTLGDFMEEFIKQRLKQGIVSHVIMPESARNSPSVKKQQARSIRRFSEHLLIDGEIRIYGDKVAVITFQKNNPVGFVFSGPLISAIFRGIFDHAWKSSKTEGK